MSEETENLDCGEKAVLFAHRIVKKINAEDDLELRKKLEGAFNKSCESQQSEDENEEKD